MNIALALASLIVFEARVTCYTYTEHTAACIFEEPNGNTFVHICIDHKCREVPKPEPLAKTKVKKLKRR